jgi:NADPH-dependent curcumin reductase CurA
MTAATNRPINRRVVLASHPDGMVKESDFRIEDEQLGELGEGEVLVKQEAISIDAFIRTALNEQEGLHTAVPIGGVIGTLGVGRVVESNNDEFAVGDAVSGGMGAQTYIQGQPMYQKIDDSQVPATAYLGALGLTTGVTAYFGILECGAAKEGDTVVVSGAAGAVGTIAAQVAKIKGCKVIGIAGGQEKCNFLVNELGLDGAIDYKNDDIDAKIKELCPGGVDVFFDNVGGELLDIVLDNLAFKGRISICGAISQYGDQQNVRGPSLYLRLAERWGTMGGFVVSYYADKFEQAYADLGQWMAEGKLVMPETVEEGIDNFPKALIGLFNGANTGKMLVKLS